MIIKAIVIEGCGGEVLIKRTDGGATIVCGERLLAEVSRADDPEARYAKATTVAGAVYGRVRGRVAATNSMVHEILDQIDRVAGC